LPHLGGAKLARFYGLWRKIMSETRKLVAILAADIAGYSRLVGADEDRTLARLRGLRSDLIDPAISVHHGRVVKRTGDGILIEFRSVVDAVRCAIEVQKGMVERNAGLPPERRIEFRVGIHLGDVVEESDGDLMGDGVNIAARLEGIADRGGICISRQVLDQIEGKLDLSYRELGRQNLKNIVKPVEVYGILFDTAVAPGSQFLTTANLKQEIRYCKAPDGVRSPRTFPVVGLTKWVRVQTAQVSWSRLSEQLFRVDKWSVCRG